MEGLCPPRLELTGDRVWGDMKRVLRKENRQHRCMQKTMQATTSQWTPHSGTTSPTMPPEPHEGLRYRNSMCPQGRALSHPAADLLTEWAAFGCPTQMGQPWSKEEIWEAVARGLHKLALSLEALAHFAKEAAEKVRLGQARIVNWDDIKDNTPNELKILPLRQFRTSQRRSGPSWTYLFAYGSKTGGVGGSKWHDRKNRPKRHN
jgi:hypothetical protein